MEKVLYESFILLKKINEILPSKMTHEEMQKYLNDFNHFKTTINKLHSLQNEKISSNKQDNIYLLDKSKKYYRSLWRSLLSVQLQLINLMDKNNFGKMRKY